MSRLELDLREREKGCVRNPVAKLAQMLARVEEGVELEIVAYEKDLPLKALELLVRGRGLGMEVLGRKGDEYRALIRRKREMHNRAL